MKWQRYAKHMSGIAPRKATELGKRRTVDDLSRPPSLDATGQTQPPELAAMLPRLPGSAIIWKPTTISAITNTIMKNRAAMLVTDKLSIFRISDSGKKRRSSRTKLKDQKRKIKKEKGRNE